MLCLGHMDVLYEYITYCTVQMHTGTGRKNLLGFLSYSFTFLANEYYYRYVPHSTRVVHSTAHYVATVLYRSYFSALQIHCDIILLRNQSFIDFCPLRTVIQVFSLIKLIIASAPAYITYVTISANFVWSH